MGHPRRENGHGADTRTWEALGSRSNWPSHGWRGRFYTCFARQARGLTGLAAAWAGWQFGPVRHWNERAWPVRPIRIGLSLPRADADALVEAPGCADAEFFSVPAGMDAASALDRFTLDAVVAADGAGGLIVTTPERDGLDAGWFDWAGPRPISYASLFPLRFDCAVLHLPADWSGTRTRGESVRTGAEHVELARALIDCAAVLSRIEPRVSPADRLMGRALLDGHERTRAGFAPYTVRRDPVTTAMDWMADRFLAVENATLPTGAQRAAARLVSAYAASGRCTLPAAQRRRIAEAADRVAGDEVEVALRLAAVLLGCYADEPALDSLRKADAVLQERLRGGLEAGVAAGVAGADPSAFIQSEIETSAGDPLALGRLAAGLCLICAPLSGEKIEYLRADTMDDMRFCDWAVGRDQDRQLIANIFTHLLRARQESDAAHATAA